MSWNVFVIGYDALGKRLMPMLRQADDYAFHPLLSVDEVVHTDEYDIDGLVDRALNELSRFPHQVDAIISYWDFPTSVLLPLLRRRLGLRGPSLESILQCEHKYWSRIEQKRVVPDCVPTFQVIDPFDENPVRQVVLNYPFWLKPITAHSSHLGFRIDDAATLRNVLPVIRAGIRRYGKPLAQSTAHAEIPRDVATVTGHHCIAESLISIGRQYTLEGYVQNGRVHVYGVVDSVRDSHHRSVLSRYVYPSKLPGSVRERMVACTRRFVEHIGYDDAPFNIEFFHDRRQDRIWLLEINSRLSRSHAALFQLVDGAPHFQVMIDVALGLPPRMPRGQGRYRLAAKQMIRVFHEGRVSRVPTRDESQQVEACFPGAIFESNVHEGMSLSRLRHQDSFSYELGVVFLGANSESALRNRLRRCQDMLPYEVQRRPNRAAERNTGAEQE
ncbi:MAG: ATP-grasp enzyme, D-alanine-D-alanine ligase [Halomonadaceae bacterium T82-2]|nr:MAG: ATP-grasp enzyme, D-alanine-D-alanine ligase [Halomonadaceae bacterium T82-2]